MSPDADLVPALRDLAFGVDQVGDARDAHVLAAVHALLLPRAVLVGHGVILIRQQREVQLVLHRKLCLARRVEYAHADDRCLDLREVRQRVAEITRLRRTSRRVVLRVEVEHHRPARVVLQAVRLSFLILQRERRRFLPLVDERHDPSVFYFLLVVSYFLLAPSYFTWHFALRTWHFDWLLSAHVPNPPPVPADRGRRC